MGLQQYAEALVDFDAVLGFDPEADQAYTVRALVCLGCNERWHPRTLRLLWSSMPKLLQATAGQAEVKGILELSGEAIEDNTAASDLAPFQSG